MLMLWPLQRAHTDPLFVLVDVTRLILTSSMASTGTFAKEGLWHAQGVRCTNVYLLHVRSKLLRLFSRLSSKFGLREPMS